MGEWLGYTIPGGDPPYPWWGFTDQLQRVIRRDSLEITKNAGGNWISGGLIPPDPSLSNAQQLLDALIPLPDPDPAVGQVWLQDDGNGLRLARQVLTVQGGKVEMTAPLTSAGHEGIREFRLQTTAADPGAGKYRMNNASQPLVTELYISAEIDGLAGILAIGVGWEVEIESPIQTAHFAITGPVIDNITWYRVPVAWTMDTGEIPNGAVCTLNFLPDNAPVVFYEVGVNWPPAEGVLVRGEESPWAPSPVPTIP